MQNKPQLGSISSGTHLPEDLIPAFAEELERLSKDANGQVADNDTRRLLERADELTEAGFEDADEADLDGLQEDLFIALEELAPPFVYFGTSPGDGADFGFWPAIEALEDAVRFSEVTQSEDSPEGAPKGDEPGAWMQVNDHGNVTLWEFDGTAWREVWSCV